jgi:hypothetical protein
MEQPILIESLRKQKLLIAAWLRLVSATRNLAQHFVYWPLSSCKSLSCDKLIYASSDMDDARRQSSEWIARLSADDVSNDDHARFEAWRNAHPHHARAYEQLYSTWSMLTAPGSKSSNGAKRVQRGIAGTAGSYS